MSKASQGRWRRSLRARSAARNEARRAGERSGLYVKPDEPDPRIYSGRWWVSWYTRAKDYRLRGFRDWLTGQTMHKRQWFTMVADVYATTTDEAYAIARRYYPDAVERFARELPRDEILGD